MTSSPSSIRTHLALVLCAVCAGAVRAEPGPAFARGAAAYDRVDYPEAIRLLRRALATESFGDQDLERAYLLYGSALLGQGEDAQAARAFATMVALHPGLEPDPDLSPKVADAIRREARRRPAPPSIAHVPPAALPPAGAELTLTAELDAAALLTPAFEYRWGDEPPTRLQPSCEGPRCVVSLPVEREARLTYRFAFATREGALARPGRWHELVRRTAAVAARSGDDEGGRTLPARPAARRWWIWALVGVVAVGAITGAAVGGTLAARADHAAIFSARRDLGGNASGPLFGGP